MRLVLACFALTISLSAQQPASTNPDTKVYKVGNGVSAPVPLVRPQPAYDSADLARNVHGDVVLSVTVDPQGLPHDIHVLRPLDPAVDKKVMEALAKWKFQPGMKDGKPVTVQASVVIEFNVAGKGAPAAPGPLKR